MTKPKRIFLSPPHMSGYEQQFVAEAFESNYIAPLGPQVDAFEKEFAERIGIPHALALSSGTAAMHLALHQVGVREGDEVIASTLTFIGSVSPVTFLGGKPVFIDADYATWNMNPDLLAEEIAFCSKKGKLPKAVIPTDLYGQCADLDRILEVCEPYEIPVIIDAAEALGATYKGHSAGVGAKAAIFSFNGNKIITTSGGGMLVSEDKDFIDQARFLSQQARDDAPHYEHSQIGFNYRMSNILAAIGRGQLKVLDDRVEAKRQIFEKYKDALKDIDGIEFMPEATYGRSNRWLTVILITPHKFGVDRETVRLALEAENIEAKPVWKPMHLQPVFDCGSRFKVQGSEIMQEKATTKIQNYPARVIGGSVAEDLFKRGLCLPSGTAMTDEDIGRVVSVILNCRGN
ncbi:DegT/DnrJ/EryC1/StrS family aminotransferase [Thermodesulfovibrionales bacterium]|nr:DegT/DnrJ/EryC1/StrS family aminotransferase [Thermodesulfovibrionales bacterium]